MKIFDRTDAWSVLTAGAVLVALFLPGVFSGDESQDRLLAETMFNRIESRFLDIRTLGYTVERIAQTSKAKQKERWTFKFKEPDDLKIEYLVPHNRLIVVNSNTMWEYIPEAAKAMRTDLTALDKDKKQEIISTVLSHVAVEGIRLGDFATMLDRITSVNVSETDKDVYVVEGTSPKYVVCIDTAKNVLVRTELYDADGRLKLRTQASSFLEVVPLFWFPQEIRIAFRTQQGLMESTVYIRNIRANEDMQDDVFNFVLPDDVTVVDN